MGPPTHDERSVIVDTGGELTMRGCAPGVSLDDFANILLTRETYRVAVQPSHVEEMEWVADACAARRDVVLYIDELDVWYPSYASLPCEGLRNMALTGRHYDQTVILVTHRPQNIHPILLSQSVLHVFPMTDARDRAAVRRHSTRPDLPGGLDPGALRVMERDAEGRTTLTEGARVDRHKVQVYTMRMPSGETFFPESS